MNQSLIIKAIAALLTVVLVLTVLSTLQSSQPLQVDDGSMINVSPAEPVWQKTFGETGDDRAFFLLPVSENFLVVGSTKIDGGEFPSGWALMFDANGNIVWNQTYLNGAGTELRYAAALADGFFLVGNQFTVDGDQNGYAAKVDCEGNLVWETVMGGTEFNKIFGGTTSADVFYLYGLTQPQSDSDGWIVKLDVDGNVVWDKNYGFGVECALRSGVSSGDELVVAGYVDQSGDGNYDFLQMKISSDGGLMWNQTYGTSSSEKAYSMTKVDDGYVLVGEESMQTSTDAWIIKTDSNGALQWSRRLGGPETDSPSYVTTAQDGSLLVCGFTFSFGEGQRDFWLFKISANGQVQFSCTFGTESFQEAYGVVDLGNNQYVMAGWTDPPNQPDMVGKAHYDFLVAKLNVSPSAAPTFNVWLIFASVISAGSLVATLILLLKIRPKKQK